MTKTGPAVPAPLEFRTRIASGVVLGAAAVMAVVGGPLLFSILVAIGGVIALREWHRLVNAKKFAWEAVPTSLAVVAVVVLVHVHAPMAWAAAAIGLGVAAAALWAASRGSWVLWHAFAALYIGVPTLALVAMREDQLRGGVLVGGVFAAVWAADTGALLLGKLIGGPRLAPQLSPNKTWAGFVGGLVAALCAEAVYVAIVGGPVWEGALFGVYLGVAAHCGDLFESWVKRQFRAKNTGTLIPGHGGVLDRIDSLLFAAPAAAVLLFGAGINPVFGGAS